MTSAWIHQMFTLIFTWKRKFFCLQTCWKTSGKSHSPLQGRFSALFATRDLAQGVCFQKGGRTIELLMDVHKYL